jgi:hypothetical protein
MSERQLSKAEYERILGAPRRRYGAFVLTDRSYGLRGRVPTPVFWFERNDIGEDEGGTYWHRPYIPVVTLMIDGWPAALFYITGKRLDSCTFAYNLTAARLAVAVSVMRKAGLRRYIRPAAEWALKEMPTSNRAILELALRNLVPFHGSRRQSRRRSRTTG